MKFTLVYELVDVPAKPSREDYIRAAERAAARGGAQRIIIEVNKPVYVERVVEVSQAPKEDAVDLFTALRNAHIDELIIKKEQTWKQGLLDSLHQVARRSCFPRYLLCTDIKWFTQNIAFPLVLVNNIYYLFGFIQVLVERRLEEGVVVLVANKSPLDRATDVSFSLKLTKL